MINPDLFTMLGQLDIVLSTGKKQAGDTSPEVLKTLSGLHAVLEQAVTSLVAAQFEFQAAVEKGALQLQKVRCDPKHRKPNDSNFNLLLSRFLAIYSQIVEDGAVPSDGDPTGTITPSYADPSGSGSGLVSGCGPGKPPRGPSRHTPGKKL
jgi:hypothetical protein